MTTITTRAGKGSPLTNNEMDANLTGLNDDKVEASGDSMTGNLSFGDNNKAIFGGSQDLQIYHDASDSIILDNGTGNLKIQADDLVLKSADGVKEYLKGTSGGSVRIRYNNTTVLETTSTGIDVTGTVTADALTVSNSFPVFKIEDSDGTNQGLCWKLEIVSSSGASFLTAQNGSSHGTINLRRTNGTETLRTMQVQTSGDIAIYADDGTTKAFYWDASTSRLGLGDTSPVDRLTVSRLGSTWTGVTPNAVTAVLIHPGTTSAGSGSALTLAGNSDSSSILYFSSDTDNDVGMIQYAHNIDDMIFRVSGSERLRIKSSGNVGIGTSSPYRTLTVSGDQVVEGLLEVTAATPQILFSVPSGGLDSRIHNDGSGNFIFGTGTNSATPTERMRIDSSGQVGIGTTLVDSLLHLQKSDVTAYSSTATDGQVGVGPTIYLENPANANTTVGGQIVFGMRSTEEQARIGATGGSAPALTFGTADAERMRIDSSGNVGIGTQSPLYELHIEDASGNAVVNIESSTTGYSAVNLGDTNNDDVGQIKYDNSTNSMQFTTNATEAVRIDSSGNVLFGATGTATNNYGAKVLKDGSSSEIFAVHRQASDGNLITFARGGTDAGGITYTGGYLNINGQVSGVTASVAGSEQLRVTASSIDVQGDAINQQAASNWYIRNRVAGGVINLGVETTGGALYYPISISGTGDTTKFRNSTGEMARFDANGRLLVGKTSQVYTTVGVQLGNYSSNSIDNTTQFTHNNSGGTSVACTAPVSESCITFHRQDTGAFMGHIRNDSSNSVSYFTSSDERLKENIVDAPSASDDIDAIQIRSFDWKADGSHQKYGVIAQELNNVIPSAVDMTQDENRHASVDFSKLVPMLVKEIQSLRARVAQLEGAN